MNIQTRLGNVPETHYADLTAAFPEWTVNHRGDGVATLFCRQEPVEEKFFLQNFPDGINTLYRVVIHGCKVYDPLSGTVAFTDNAASVIRDYMAHADGMRLPPAIFGTPMAAAAWYTAAARCNEAIALTAGGSEARYRLWGSYYLDERPADVLGRMLQCCDGRLYPTADGGLALDIGAWAEPTVVLDENAIVGFSDLARGKDILSTANTIRATYLGVDQDYQTTDADPWVDAVDVSERGELEFEIALLMCPSHTQARRLMKLAAYRQKPRWVGTIQTNLMGLAAAGERFVRITYPLFEIDEVFEVQNFQIIVGEGNILQGVTLEVQSMPSDAYAWDPAEEEGDAPVAGEIDEGRPHRADPGRLRGRDLRRRRSAASPVFYADLTWTAPVDRRARHRGARQAHRRRVVDCDLRCGGCDQRRELRARRRRGIRIPDSPHLDLGSSRRLDRQRRRHRSSICRSLAMANEVTAAFNTAFRDFALDGITSSGANKPKKVEVRAIGPVIDGAITSLTAIATAGIKWLPSSTGTIRVRSTANVAIASGLVNGATLNGVTLATGNHVFLGLQTNPAENGLYTVVASGAAPRATFADSAAELGYIGFVIQSGTAGAGEQWTLPIAAASITLGTTALNFAQTGIADPYAAEIVEARGSYPDLDDRLDGIDAEMDTVQALTDTTTRAPTPYGYSDEAGYLVPVGSERGYDFSFGLTDCDTIVHYGDSYTDATYVLKDKAWVSVVSNFSPFRHVNMGDSGNWAERIYEQIQANRCVITPGVSWEVSFRGNTAWHVRHARYAVVATWTNDQSQGGPAAWTQHMKKNIDLLRSFGAQPVIMAEARPTTITTKEQYSVMSNLAREAGCDFVDAQHMSEETRYSVGPFTDGSHPGTRTGALYWSPMLRWLDGIPRPQRSIKVYNLRGTVVVGSLADLIFRDIYGLVNRFKEIGLGHVCIADVNLNNFEEIDKANWTGGTKNVDRYDEYAQLASGYPLTLTDYALLRVALPAHARGIKGIGVQVGTNATEVYVFNRFATNTHDTDTPTGAWEAVTLDGDMIQLDNWTLAKCMSDNELLVLLHKTGGVTLARPVVHWSGFLTGPERRLVRTYEVVGSELLTVRTCASLTGWTTVGSPAVVVPFDLSMGAPRDPAAPANPIGGVIEVTSANKIRQGTAVVASKERQTVYRLRVWARYWPKVFLDNTIAGYGFPAAQVVDRSAGFVFPDDSPINYETFDWRLVTLEATFAAAAAAPTAYEKQEKMVGLYWTPLDFYVSTLTTAFPCTLNWQLSSSDGTVQIGKVSLVEVIEHEHHR